MSVGMGPGGLGMIVWVKGGGGWAKERAFQ
jgi:hypothetical protein